MPNPSWLAFGLSQLGVHEWEGQKSNPFVEAYFKQAGFKTAYRDDIPWCAAFVGACLKVTNMNTSHSLMARSFLSVGMPLKEEKLGALAIFSRGSDPRFGHVGFVVGRTKGDWLILGGNQDNKVSIAVYKNHRLLGLRWPQPAFGELKEIKQTYGDFSNALAHVLGLEGGWSDHPLDRGGPTNYGITIATYARYKKRPLNQQTRGALVRGLHGIKPAEVEKIYRKFYWNQAHCERMSHGIALMHFDAAVNHGVHRAIRFLQTALQVSIDGIYGRQTAQALRGANLPDLINDYAQLRERFYKKLQTYPSFGRGWMNRLQTTTQAALQLARSKPLNTEQPNLNNQNKETRTMTDAPKWWGESLTLWGTIVTALATVVPVIGPLFGFDVTGDMVEQFGQNVANILQALGGVVGTLMAVFGRFRARQPLMRRPIQFTL